MERIQIIDLLCALNANNPADCIGDVNVLCEINVSNICKECCLNNEDVTDLAKEIHAFNPLDFSNTWKYICLNFYLLNLLKDSLEKSSTTDVLSVQQTKTIKNVIRNVIGVGIACNLQPNLPKYCRLPSEHVDENHSVINSYNRLAGTTHGIVSYIKCLKLRSTILLDNFQVILSSIYQIVHCPIKKPSTIKDATGFVMTEDIYNRLLTERELFKSHLKYLATSLHINMYVRESMMLAENTSPMWLKKAISQNLSAVLRSPKGIETIAWAMFECSVDFDPNDRAKNWKTLDIITKLILSLKNSADFKENICKQLIEILKLKDSTGQSVKLFENIYVLCTKKLYNLEPDLCKSVLMPCMYNPVMVLTTYGHKFSNDENITESISQAIRLVHSSSIENNIDYPDLPIELLTPVMDVMFRLYSTTITSSLTVLNNQVKDILVKYLDACTDIFPTFDTFLFGINNAEMNKFRDDVYVEVKGDLLMVKHSDHQLKNNINKMGNALMDLCKNNNSLSISLFLYLLNCLIERDKYFNINTNKDLLNVESNFVIDEAIERNLLVYHLLSTLSEDKVVQNYIGENPTDVIKYIENVLRKTLETSMHKTEVYDSDGFQSVFTIIMILQALVMNATKENLQHYKKLVEILQALRSETINIELKNLLNSVMLCLTDKQFEPKMHGDKIKTELDVAIEDVCDPLLPVRGHGLMTLTKLIEKKDSDALERKQYILNIFQQNLKNEDSFIYLSAIGGLAAMGDVFPDIVINTLADEYSDFSKKNSEEDNELRMKLGEVLVRITRSLGEIAPKHKTVLLNAFLMGTKDDDHLMRASSLSNLGEICRVLGYKLGTIITEVLVCVHAIIATDKAVEARRAAVTVIRQLLAGLESEMIAFLKDDILEIYRTLKNIYYNDHDDVMRLQAQLALEELNENMRNFVLPKLELHKEKIVMLN